MIQQAVCPRCGNTVTFPIDQQQVPCPQCGVTLARKGTVRRPEPEPEPPPGPTSDRKRRRKRARGRQGRKLVRLAIAGSFVLGVLLVGSMVWALATKKRPAVADAEGDPGQAVAQQRPAGFVNPLTPPALPWKAKADPPASTDFPAEGFIELPQIGVLVYQAELRGRHVVHLAPPAADPKGIPVLRVVDLHTGKAVGEVPQQFLHCAVSEDGKRVSAVFDETPPAAPEAPRAPRAPRAPAPRVKVLKVCELPGLKVLHSLPVGDVAWHDFAKDADHLVVALGGQFMQHGVSLMFLDLKAEKPEFKPLPLARPRGRGQTHVAVSPGRTFLAVTGERHVELFNLTDGTHAGVIDAPGNVVRCAFSPDGAELLVWSQTAQQRVRTLQDREQVPLQWTTFALADGRELRKVEATALIVADRAGVLVGPEPDTIVVAAQAETLLYDVRVGAPFERFKWKALRALDADRLIVHDAEKGRLRVEKLDPQRLEARRAELRGLLGERPEAVTPDTKGAQVVFADGAAWRVPVEPAPKPRDGTPQLLTSPDPDNEFLYPRADAPAWSAVVSTLETKPRLRHALSWRKFDLRTGKAGPPVALWPSALAPGQTVAGFGHGTLKADQSAAADKIALRDPKDPGRVDVWDDTGKRLTGFHPHEKKAEVAWLAWANGDRLLTLADGVLTGWDGPSAKAVWRGGDSYSNVFLAPTRRWVAGVTKQHLDLLDTESGKPVGRLALPGEGDWPAVGVSQDGARLYAARAARAQQGGLGMIEYAVWDLRSGGLIRTDKGAGSFGLQPGAVVHELSEKQLLVGNQLLDLDCGMAIATLALPTNPAGLPLAMHGDRLWFPVVMNPGHGGVSHINQMMSKRIPADLDGVPAIRPADIVFRPGTTVKVAADLGNRGRDSKARELFEKSLRDGGYVVGDGGWTLEVTGKAAAGSQRLTATGGGSVAVPSVSGSVRLVAPDGSAVGAGGFSGSFGQKRSKYYTSSETVGLGGSITHYNFGGRNPTEAMAEEAWEDAMQALPLGLRYPRILAKVGGQLTPLPVTVKVR